MPYSQLVDSSR